MLPRPLRARAHRVANDLIQRGWARLRVAGAIAPGTAAAERFGSFGPGSVIAFPTATLYGEASIHLGAGTMVSTWSTLAAGYSPDQDTVPPRALVIGDRCVIGMRSGIVAHESIEIGDDVWFGQEVYVTDANHGYQDPETPIGRQLGPHQSVVIGAGSWIGHGSVVLPGARIGRNVVVAAGSVVRGEIPDHAVVGGVPAKVIRRYDPAEEGWVRDADTTATTTGTATGAGTGTGDAAGVRDAAADRVRPRSKTIPPEDLAAALASLEEG